MHVHTDLLTLRDVLDVLRTTGLDDRGVYLDWSRTAVHGSRSRERRLDVYLIAADGHGRRYGNTGNRGAGYDKAALYDEWGAFIAGLFLRDPDALIGPYTADNFIERARRYRPAPDRARHYRADRNYALAPDSIAEYAALYLPTTDQALDL